MHTRSALAGCQDLQRMCDRSCRRNGIGMLSVSVEARQHVSLTLCMNCSHLGQHELRRFNFMLGVALTRCR